MATEIRVLVVEDNQDLREIIHQFLDAYGFAVVTAKDGQEGLELFESEAPTVVLADVLLPRMNGFQLCDKIKHGARPVPVVLMSALYKTYNLQMEAKTKYGADEYLIKPLDLMKVAKMLSRLAGVERPSRPAANATAENGNANAAPGVPPRPAPAPDFVRSPAAADKPLTGDLQDVPVAEVIGHLFRARRTGRLTVTVGDVVRVVYVRHGTPRYVHSKSPAESFVRLLVQDGKITGDQLIRAERQSKEKKQTIGKTLVENGLIASDDLEAYLLREVDYRMSIILGLDSGLYSFDADESWLAKINRPEINIYNLVYQAVAAAPAGRLAAYYDGLRERLVAKNGDRLAIAGQIEWRDEHLEVFMGVDGANTLGAIVDASEFGADIVYQLIYTLELFDAIRFR